MKIAFGNPNDPPTMARFWECACSNGNFHMVEQKHCRHCKSDEADMPRARPYDVITYNLLHPRYNGLIDAYDQKVRWSLDYDDTCRSIQKRDFMLGKYKGVCVHSEQVDCDEPKGVHKAATRWVNGSEFHIWANHKETLETLIVLEAMRPERRFNIFTQLWKESQREEFHKAAEVDFRRGGCTITAHRDISRLTHREKKADLEDYFGLIFDTAVAAGAVVCTKPPNTQLNIIRTNNGVKYTSLHPMMYATDKGDSND